MYLSLNRETVTQAEDSQFSSRASKSLLECEFSAETEVGCFDNSGNAIKTYIVMDLVDLTGLSQCTRIIMGSLKHTLQYLHSKGILKEGVNVIFLDHVESMYRWDL